MRHAFDSISKGLLLIAIGGVFLLINFGFLSWGFWLSAIDLWPLLLILVGIGLLFSKKVPLSAIVLVFLLILVGYSFVFGDRLAPFPYGAGGFFPQTGKVWETEAFPADLKLPEGVKKAEVDMKLGGAKVALHSLANGADNAQQLVKGSYQWQSNRWESALGPEKPTLEAHQSGDTMYVSYSTFKGGGISDNLDLGLSNKVDYSFDIDGGAINGDLDFSQLPVESLKLNTGASKFRLSFGDSGKMLTGEISSGASDITLVVPENVGLKVHLSGVASKSNFMGSGLLMDNKDWASPGYDQAETKIDLDISLAAGSVNLERPDGSQV